MARLGKSMRTKLRKIETHMHEIDGGMSVELLDAQHNIPAAVDDLVRLYRLRWRDQVGGSVFCNPANVAFYRALLRWGVDNGTAIVPVLRLRGNTVAVGVVWHQPAQRNAYFQFIARDVTALPNHWLNCPGTVLICHVIRWAMARGVERMHMGRGNAHYKLLLGGETDSQWQLSLARSEIAAALLPQYARSLYLLHRAPLHLAYHLRRLANVRSPRSDTGKHEPDGE